MPDGSTAQNAYHGLVTTETNAHEPDAHGDQEQPGQKNLVAVKDALNATMTYAYDPTGN